MLTEKTNTQEIIQKTFDFKCFEGTDRCFQLKKWVGSNTDIDIVSISETNKDVTVWYWY